MEFENTFAVKAPIDEVYDALLDIERVAPCMPGAQVIERTGDDAYKVGIKVRVGPVAMQYRGDVEIVARDPAAHVAVMRANAKETRGQGTANARIELRLSDEGEATRGRMATEVRLSGKAAAMGRGVIQDVSAKLTEQFAANLAAMLEGGAPAPAAGPSGEELAAAEASSGAAQSATTKLRADAAAAKGELPAAQPRTEPPPPPGAAARQPAAEEALPVLGLLGSVLAGRLRDPRVLGALGALGALGLLVRRLRR
jgi:carbon monoxide dehydrogenase subunit G